MIGASALIEQTIKLYRTHFRTLLMNVISIFIIVGMVLLFVSFLLDRAGIRPLSSIGIVANVLFLLIFQLPLTIILFVAADKIISGGLLRFDELWKNVRSHFLPALGVYVVIGAMIALLAGIAYLGYEIANHFAPPNGGPDAGARFALFAAVAGIIATIISIFFYFSPPEIILHGGTVKHALLTSLKLIRGRFWRIAWRLFAPTAFFGVAVSLVGTLLGYVAKETARDITDGILNALVAPLFIIPLILLYHDVKKV